MNLDYDTDFHDESNPAPSHWDDVVRPPDDVRVGMYVALYSIKGENRFTANHGLACKVLAVNYPSVFGYHVMDPRVPVHFDFRYHELMEVGEAFAKAQAPGLQGGRADAGGVALPSTNNGNTARPRRKGVVLTPEELRVGNYVSLYALKGDDRFSADHGLACKVLALALPYITGYYVTTARGPVRYDLRYHDVREVDEPAANAQLLFARATAGQQFEDRSAPGRMK